MLDETGEVRLNRSKDTTDLVDRIDEKDILSIKQPRIKLYLYALALALEDNEHKPIVTAYPGGFIKESNIQKEDEVYLYSHVISRFIDENNGNIEDIIDKKNVYSVSDEYANAGFAKLEKLFFEKSKIDSVSLMLELLAINEKIYQKNYKNNSVFIE